MYTPGILGKDGEIQSSAAVDAAYRVDDGHLTRSYAHTVFRDGALAQEMIDNGEVYFAGSSATDFGSIVDRAVAMTVAGVGYADLFIIPPSEVLASDGSKKGKKYTDWRDSQDPESTILTQADLEKLNRVMANTLNNKAVREIFDDTKDCQAAFRWTDENNNKRKALADGMTEKFLWDFKTTSSPWWKLTTSCYEYGYFWQDAWYEDAAIAHDYEPHRLRFIFAQTVKPYAVRVYELDQDVVDKARKQIDSTLHQIQLRKELGIYRSIEDDEVLTLDMPAWAKGGT
jgi:hypothetical protein